MSRVSGAEVETTQKTPVNGRDIVEQHRDILEEIIEGDMPFAEGAERLIDGVEEAD